MSAQNINNPTDIVDVSGIPVRSTSVTADRAAHVAQVPLYQAIARTIEAIKNCETSGNTEWLLKHKARLNLFARNHLPSGAGFDSGTKIDLERTSLYEDRIILTTDFHHMDENGHYNGWTSHVVTVVADLSHNFTLRISGKNRNGWKDMAHDVFQIALSEMVSEYPEVK